MTLNLRRFAMLQFSRDAKLLMASSGILAISFLGIQGLLKTLYILRLGYGLEYVGVFGATGAFAYMLMSLPSGLLGSRLGTRTTMLLGGIITVLSMATLPFTEFVPLWARDGWPLLAQVLLSCGWALFTVNLVPALMTVTTVQNRNDAYAMSGLFRGLGTLIGTVSGGLLPGWLAPMLGQTTQTPAPYQLALWIAAVLGIAALVPLFMLDKVGSVTFSDHAVHRGAFPTWLIVLVILHVYLSQSTWAICQTFCNPYMDTQLHLSAASIGLITGVGQSIAVLAPLITPALARRYNNGWTLMITTLGTGISLTALVLAPHWLAVGIGLLGMQTLNAVWMTALQVYQMEMVERHWRALAYGIVSMAMGFTFATVSLGGGYMATAWGYRSLFLLGVGTSIVGAALMWGMQRQPKPSLTVVVPAVES
ncbi:hypothetical protein BH10CHL1_BH10CHL1_48360 [soil metagenome]